MSILACLIGILTLMISVSMKANQAKQEGKTEEEMARAVANRDLRKKAEHARKEAAKLEERLVKEKSTAVMETNEEYNNLLEEVKRDRPGHYKADY